ncbi:MAG TPA: hypothetical protein VIX80_09815, partial [Candidatus Kapabacteria bacterium]
MTEPTHPASRKIIGIFIAIFLFTLTSCEEKLSGIGYNFLRDTVAVKTTTLGDSGIFISSPVSKKDINALGVTFAFNYASPHLFIGKAPTEDIESWIILKAPLVHDSVGSLVSAYLELPMRNTFLYGETTSDSISFSVFLETSGKVTDSTRTLSKADLSANPVGFGHAKVAKDSLGTIKVTLNSTLVAPFIHTASLAFVLVPNDEMRNIRSFAATDAGDVLLYPKIHYSTLKNGDTAATETDHIPKFDYHLVTDDASVLPGTFRLRGAAANRHRFTLNIKAIREQLALDPFVTFNNGLLQLQLDATSSSVVPTDTIAPILAEITTPETTDSAVILRSYGFRDDMASNAYNFQIREVIEKALRNGLDSVVLELRTGYAQRLFTG